MTAVSVYAVDDDDLPDRWKLPEKAGKSNDKLTADQRVEDKHLDNTSKSVPLTRANEGHDSGSDDVTDEGKGGKHTDSLDSPPSEETVEGDDLEASQEVDAANVEATEG